MLKPRCLDGLSVKLVREMSDEEVQMYYRNLCDEIATEKARTAIIEVLDRLDMEEV